MRIFSAWAPAALSLLPLVCNRPLAYNRSGWVGQAALRALGGTSVEPSRPSWGARRRFSTLSPLAKGYREWPLRPPLLKWQTANLHTLPKEPNEGTHSLSPIPEKQVEECRSSYEGLSQLGPMGLKLQEELKVLLNTPDGPGREAALCAVIASIQSLAESPWSEAMVEKMAALVYTQSMRAVSDSDSPERLRQVVIEAIMTDTGATEEEANLMMFQEEKKQDRRRRVWDLPYYLGGILALSIVPISHELVYNEAVTQWFQERFPYTKEHNWDDMEAVLTLGLMAQAALGIALACMAKSGGRSWQSVRNVRMGEQYLDGLGLERRHLSLMTKYSARDTGKLTLKDH